MGTCSIAGCENFVRARKLCGKHYMRWWTHGDPLTIIFEQSVAGAPRDFLYSLPLTGDGCVPWPFSTNNKGYAQISTGDGKKRLASRVSCERKNGPPPDRKHQAAHECGKGHLGCVAPWHLAWKLPVDNMDDQIRHGTRSRGEHHHAKLTEREVLEIRSSAGVVSQATLAITFGISQSAVSKIMRRKIWAHVP